MTRAGHNGLMIGGLMAGLAFGIGLPAGCAQPCCTFDEYPINLLAPPDDVASGGLRANAQSQDSATMDAFTLAIDTGSPLTVFRRQPNQAIQMGERNFDILDATTTVDGTRPAVRGRLRRIGVLPLDLGVAPDAVLGGDFLRNFSVQVVFSAPTLTFWTRQGAEDPFLANAGFAVLHFNLLGGAELTATSTSDFLGLTGPVEMPATRIVLRACGGPDTFDADATTQPACPRGCEGHLASGTDLALLVATGVGPLVLSQSAWNRVFTRLQAAPPDALPVVTGPGPDLPIPYLATPITDVKWSSLPRLALVDQEADASNDPGACVELGHARRLEWVERHQAEAACVQPCDTDLRDSTLAQNAAAYIELGGNIPVAIIPDTTPFLQGLRAEVRPIGPEIDGLVGAGVLSQTSVELDYPNQPSRALFSCANGATRATCWTSPRCPRLANQGDVRACFGQMSRTEVPPVCSTSGVCG